MPKKTITRILDGKKTELIPFYAEIPKSSIGDVEKIAFHRNDSIIDIIRESINEFVKKDEYKSVLNSVWDINPVTGERYLKAKS